MANLLAATAFRSYLPRLGTGGTEAANYPVTNLRLLLHPERAWRTTTTGAQAAILDLGSDAIPKAYLLQDCNFPTVSIGLSSSATFASDVNPRFTTVAVPFLDKVRRRRAWLHDPTNTLSKRYVRVTALGSADDGAAFYQLGVVAIVTDFLDLGIGAKAITTRRTQAIGHVPFRDGGEDIRAHGPSALEVTIERDEWITAEQETLWTIYNAGLARPVAVFENGNDPSRFYLGRRSGAVDYSGQLNVAHLPLVLQEAP